MRFDQKAACANKLVYYCSRFHMPIFHCMGRWGFFLHGTDGTEQISTEKDVCYILFTEEMVFFHQTFDIDGWCC